MRKLTTTQWLFAGIAALLVILAWAILYGNAHRPSPFRPKERITAQAPKRSDLVEGLRVCTGLGISDVPTLKSQYDGHFATAKQDDPLAKDNPNQNVGFTLVNDTGLEIYSENVAFYGDNASMSVMDTDLHPSELVAHVNNVFSISQNSWEGDGNPMHRLILPKWAVSAYPFTWWTNKWNKADGGTLVLFASKQTSDSPPCAYIIPMDFVAKNSPLNPEKVLSDIRKAYGAE